MSCAVRHDSLFSKREHTFGKLRHTVRLLGSRTDRRSAPILYGQWGSALTITVVAFWVFSLIQMIKILILRSEQEQDGFSFKALAAALLCIGDAGARDRSVRLRQFAVRHQIAGPTGTFFYAFS